MELDQSVRVNNTMHLSNANTSNGRLKFLNQLALYSLALGLAIRSYPPCHLGELRSGCAQKASGYAGLKGRFIEEHGDDLLLS
jgi:hypothetical protein